MRGFLSLRDPKTLRLSNRAVDTGFLGIIGQRPRRCCPDFAPLCLKQRFGSFWSGRVIACQAVPPGVGAPGSD